MLKVALIGCGKIADGHVEQIRATGRAEVVAVCDREDLMVEQLATRMGIAGRYTDAREMLAASGAQVVHIATPPDSHPMLARLALDAGCHVFIEKPFALNATDAASILDHAAQAGRHCSVNYLYNFESPALQAQAMLDRHAIGEIVHIDSAYGYNLGGDYGTAVMADPGHWVHKLPGKLFHNVLDHVLAKVVPHLDEDPLVKVMAWRRRPSTGIAALDAMPDELRVMLRAGDVTANVTISAHGRPVAHSLRLVGTRDTLELDLNTRTVVQGAQWSQPSALGRLFPPWVQARRFAANGWRNLGAFRRHEFHYFQGMRVLLTRFYDAVEGRGADPIPAAQILRVCRIIDSIVAEIARESHA